MESGDSLTGYSLVQFSGTESLLTNSQYAKVIFHDVVEECSSEQDFVCKYSNQVSFSSQAGDRVVLFKLGWHRVTDYEIFEWAPLQTMNKNVFKVVFPADTLPKNTNEFYQLCYISGKNDICGASVPFQFCMNMFPVSLPYKDFREVIPEKNTMKQNTELIGNLSTISKSMHSPLECNNAVQIKLENDRLKHSLRLSTSAVINCESQLYDLKRVVQKLQQEVSSTQNDVSEMKIRIKMAGVEFRKVHEEKTRAERKYEKLLKKCQNHKKGTQELNMNVDCDLLGELEPFPVFPFDVCRLAHN